MIKDIIKDKTYLSFVSGNVDIENENIEIIDIVTHLIDTANDNKDVCAGLAANQISYLCNIFVVKIDDEFVPIINAEVICKAGGIKSGYESCLSRPDDEPIKVRRSKEIKIKYYDVNSNEYIIKKYKGILARCVQHEIDHTLGILI